MFGDFIVSYCNLLSNLFHLVLSLRVSTKIEKKRSLIAIHEIPPKVSRETTVRIHVTPVQLIPDCANTAVSSLVSFKQIVIPNDCAGSLTFSMNYGGNYCR